MWRALGCDLCKYTHPHIQCVFASIALVPKVTLGAPSDERQDQQWFSTQLDSSSGEPLIFITVAQRHLRGERDGVIGRTETDLSRAGVAAASGVCLRHPTAQFRSETRQTNWDSGEEVRCPENRVC